MGASTGTNAGHNELTNSHTDGAKEQQRASTPFLNHPETRKGRGDVNARCNDCGNEGVLNTRVCEELSTIIKDKIYSRQLLKCLEQATGR